MLAPTTNIKEAYKHGRDDEQNFIQNLALFLCTFLKEHKNLIEKQQELHDLLLEAMHYLILISEVEETEIFKICLEYWNALASELYRENPFGSCSPLLLSRPSQPSETPSKRQLYDSVLHKVCTLSCVFRNTVDLLFSVGSSLDDFTHGETSRSPGGGE